MIPLSEALALHHAVTWFLTGLIWVVQLLQYPMFADLNPTQFARAHAFHSRRITILVAPAMLVELCSAAFLVTRLGPAHLAATTGFILVLVNWIATASIMIPLHNRLAGQEDVAKNVPLLVRWNWIRTITWSTRAVICLLWL